MRGARPLANPNLCRITFSVNTDVNHVTVTIAGGGWTYGDAVTFAVYEGTADGSATIVVVADSLLNDSPESVSYTYAYWREGDYSDLSFTMSVRPDERGAVCRPRVRAGRNGLRRKRGLCQVHHRSEKSGEARAGQ